MSIDLSKASRTELGEWYKERMGIYRDPNFRCNCRVTDPSYSSLYGLSCIHRSVAGIFPECLSFWKDDTNPRTISPGSQREITFECKRCRTSYSVPLRKFLQCSGCASCSGGSKVGTQITFERSVAANPRMLSMWSPNNVDDPRNVCQSSGQSHYLWVCQNSHEWSARPSCIKSGRGCLQCYRANHAMPVDEVKRRFTEIWNGLYEYDWTSYKSFDTPMTMYCRTHGAFSKAPFRHYKGRGCIKCLQAEGNYAYGYMNMTWEIVFARCVEVWGDAYTYDPTSWKTSKIPFTVICRKHGPFSVLLHSFLRGASCPKCGSVTNSSKGVRSIKRFLETGSISYRQEHRFEDLKGDLKSVSKPLPYDFIACINGTAVLIEYDGQQHFYPVSCFGGDESFQCTQRYDFLKDQYAIEHDISLIRIPYWANTLDVIEVLIKAIVEINKGNLVYISYDHYMREVSSPNHVRLSWVQK